jgi:hypothetical protein
MGSGIQYKFHQIFENCLLFCSIIFKVVRFTSNPLEYLYGSGRHS